ncbi:MAG: hypothetical protein LV473_06485 [Nitrospira sp.]|nr:hypothetical protein [Nitrospira sp.]
MPNEDKWYISGPLIIEKPDQAGQLDQGRLTFFSDSADVEFDGGKDGIFVFRNTAPEGETVFVSDSSLLSLDTNADSKDAGIRFKERGTLKWHIWNAAQEKKLCISRHGLGPSLTINEAGNVGIAKELTVGAGGNALVKTRHIEGKSGQNDDADTLYLNWVSGKGVEIGEPSRRSNLAVWGNVGIGTSTPAGKLDVQGDIRAGNSDLYFTKTDHAHSGIGNTAGYAAIENASNFDALMILGRAGTDRGRKVRLWDYLEVNGPLEVTGDLAVKGSISTTKGHVPVVAGITNVKIRFGVINIGKFKKDDGPWEHTLSHGETFTSKESYVVLAKASEIHEGLGTAIFTTYECKPSDTASFKIRWKFEWNKNDPLPVMIQYIVIGR